MYRSDENETNSDSDSSGYFTYSSSEVENFDNAEGADENGNWEVDFLGEEVDGRGNVRYEVAWKGWSRADGTNTTWNNDLIHENDIKAWKQIASARRKKLAAESLDIEIWATTDIHNTATRLREQAFAEKLKIRQRNPLTLRQDMERLLARDRGEENGPPVSGTRSGRPFTRESSTSTLASHAEGSRASSSRSANPPSSSRDSSGSKTRRAPAATVRRSMTASSSEWGGSGSFSSLPSSPGSSKKHGFDSPASMSRFDTPDIDDTTGTPGPRRLRSSPRKLSARAKLQQEWNSVARGAHAAAITIVNDVDDEEVPPLVNNFRYIEAEYVFSDKIKRNDKQSMISQEELFVRCDCDECVKAEACGCQAPSRIVDERGEKAFAYTPDGLFAFNTSGFEVIECNKHCQCDRFTCPNRVAQMPRDIPVEVFKTDDRGWGVRSSSHAVQPGKVLGIYTGLLIHREDAEALDEDEKSYCFDLDGGEDLDADVPDDAYSVDSMTCGNWTRFINHSCSPNLQVYLVVYDTIPEVNRPYIAFVATKHIPAGTEFTFDYDPAATQKIALAQSKSKGKGKGKTAVPEGATPCRCGSVNCRGWVRA